MATRSTVDSIEDLSPRALGQLRMWMETWMRKAGPIDSTENVNPEYGVRSIGDGDYETADFFLMADGTGGSLWKAGHAGFAHSNSLEVAMSEPGTLKCWYRLGETGTWPTFGNTTLNFCVDSAPGGLLGNLAARHTGLNATGFTPTLDANGGYYPTAADDGAIIFNVNGRPAGGGAGEFRVDLEGSPNILKENSTTGSTISFWLKRTTPTLTSGTGINGIFMGNFYRSFGGDGHGFRMYIPPSTGILTIEFWNNGTNPLYTFTTSGGLITGEWHWVVIQLQNLGAGSFRRRVLIDLVPLANFTGSSTVTGAVTTAGTDTTLGGGWLDDLKFEAGCGGIDELARWDSYLSDNELSDIYYSNVFAAGDIWWTDTILPGDVASGTITADKLDGKDTALSTDASQYTVPTADGSGGVTYSYPTINVYANGV